MNYYKNWEFVWNFPPDCKEFEDELGYRHLIKNGEEITSNVKAIACWYVDDGEWYWQDESGKWRFGNKPTNDSFPIVIYM